MTNDFFNSSFARQLFFIVVILILSVTISFFFIRFGIVVLFIVLGAFSLALFFVYVFKNKKSFISSSTLVVLLVVTFPFQRFILTTIPVQAIAQLIPIILVFCYWNKYDLDKRYKYFRRVKPLFYPTAVFVFSFFLSYFISGNLENKDWSFLINLIGSIGYAYLACFYCDSMANIKKMIWILIGIGVIQLPVMYAMSRGWTNGLPGAFAVLDNYSYGGSMSLYKTTTMRYPGTFPSYELLAEYLDMMVLFCIGIFIFTTSRKDRIFALISSCGLIIAGFFTGTRAFIIGIGTGVAVMTTLIALKQGFGKKITKLFIIGGFLVLVLIYLSTQDFFRGYIERFITTDLSEGYYDSRDIVWNISIILSKKVPFTGYGNQMMEVFNNQGGSGFAGPHSLYFSMLLIAGYPGLLALLIMIFTPMFWLFRILFSKNRYKNYEWSIILLSVWIFWMVNEIKIEFIRHTSTMNILFLLLGVFAGYYDLARRNPRIIKRQTINGES